MTVPLEIAESLIDAIIAMKAETLRLKAARKRSTVRRLLAVTTMVAIAVATCLFFAKNTRSIVYYKFPSRAVYWSVSVDWFGKASHHTVELDTSSSDAE